MASDKIEERRDKMERTVEINTETIQLDQFLKWANLVGSGGEAKNLIQAGEVMVNEEIEYSRSREIKPGDMVQISGDEDYYRVSSD